MTLTLSADWTVLGQLVGVSRVLHLQHLGHARDLGRGVGGAVGALARDQHMHVAAQLGGSADGVERRRAQGGVVVIGDYKDAHL